MSDATTDRAAKYRTIVVDPPWDHSDGTGVDIRNGGRVTHLPYPTMTLDAIKALPIHDLSDNVDDDADLYLWTTSRYLRDGFDIIAAWGFHYAATLVWCKPSRGWSTGGSFQNNVEFVLYAKRPKVVRRPDHLAVTTYLAEAADRLGLTRSDIDDFMGTSDMGGWWLSRIEHRCAIPTDEQWDRLRGFLGLNDEMTPIVREINARKGTDRNPTPQTATSRWFQWSRGEHSAKPEAFLDLVEQVSPGPYLELFARRQRLGWSTWGNEALEHVEMPA